MVPTEGAAGPCRSHNHGSGDVSLPMSAPSRQVWAALGVVYFVWGSTYLGIKIAVETLPPLLTAGTRFLTAGVILATVLALRRTSLRVSLRELASCALAGLALLTLGVGL